MVRKLCHGASDWQLKGWRTWKLAVAAAVVGLVAAAVGQQRRMAAADLPVCCTPNVSPLAPTQYQ